MEMSDPVVIGALGAVASAGAAAVGQLWSRIGKQQELTQAALDECQEEHKKARSQMDTLFETVGELKSTVGRLEGRMEGWHEAEEEAERKRQIERQGDVAKQAQKRPGKP